MIVNIEKIDDFGRGIGFVDGKIIFIPNTIIGDIVDVLVVKENKKYLIGKVNKFIKYSSKRINSVCPYYNKCGGCQYHLIDYDLEIKTKLDNFNNNLRKNKINYIVNDIIYLNRFNYRNKLSLKVVNGIYGFYENDTHSIVNIDYCYLVNSDFNNMICNVKKLCINNGLITIRQNINNEFLIIIDSNDNIDINKIDLDNIVGIILNNDVIYGNNYFIDIVNDVKYKVMYDSFFQVNREINSMVLKYINSLVNENDKVLDLYCGVGNISLSLINKCSDITGVEINKSSINCAKYNNVLNNSNVLFIKEDSSSAISYIENKDVVILDPPRSGITTSIANKIIDENINKVIYMSCNPNTLFRDLRYFDNYYTIKDIKLFDMFPCTYHVETVCVLERK